MPDEVWHRRGKRLELKQQAESTLHLWSAGNVRLPTGRDLTMPPQEAIELIEAMASDVRVCLFCSHLWGVG